MPDSAFEPGSGGAGGVVPGGGADRGAFDAERSVERTSTLNLSALGPDPAPARPAQDSAGIGLQPGTALLVVRHGPNAGSRFLLDQDVTSAGRHPESDIFLDDVTVSRRHATFDRVGTGFVVKDLGSLNGTYVNRERIEGSVELAGGDEVQIGRFRLTVLLAEVAP